MLYCELFYKVIHIYRELLYMVMYEVYGGKLLVHTKGIITYEAETVPTGNMK
jgi:hypothetical protein